MLERCAVASIGINSATMGLAVAGLLPPVAAATIHNGSTVGILGYAALNGAKDAIAGTHSKACAKSFAGADAGSLGGTVEAAPADRANDDAEA